MKPRPLRIVAPFRPFVPEATHHRALAGEAFDWIDAMRMMSRSAALACGGCPVHIVTDVDTDLPLPMLKYVTAERRLMLWNLEVSACYLESDDFDRDTVMLDSDQLVFRDLRGWFERDMDLGILIRPRPKGATGIPILNGVQFWAYRGKARLAGFYRCALEIAKQLPESQIRWGADTEALRVLLEPLDLGRQERGGLSVSLIDYTKVLEALSSESIRRLDAGEQLIPPTRAVLDFRYFRKRKMRAVYDAFFTDTEAVA